MSAAAFARPGDVAQSSTALCARIDAWAAAGYPTHGTAWDDAVAASFALKAKIEAARRAAEDHRLYLQALDNLADVIDAEIERLRESEGGENV